MPTITKTSKRAKLVIANARDIKCYSLGNSFKGEPLVGEPVVWGGPIVNNQYSQLVRVSQSEFLAHELSGMHAKLTGENGHYTLHIHSNLWYEFAA